MQVSDDQIKDMIKNVSDPNLRAQYEAALIGSTHTVTCVKGKVVIGERNVLGAWVDIIKTAKNKKPKHALRSTRQRLDGQTGFACRCGNSSITSEAEAGIITGAAPSRKDLQTVFERQKKDPTTVDTAEDGTVTVDGFSIKPLGVGA